MAVAAAEAVEPGTVTEVAPSTAVAVVVVAGIAAEEP